MYFQISFTSRNIVNKFLSKLRNSKKNYSNNSHTCMITKMIIEHDISLKIYDSSRLQRVIYNIHFARMTDNAFLSRRHQDPILDNVASFSGR